MNEVYLITNLVNGKRYVGVTHCGYLNRYKGHIQSAKQGRRTALYDAMRKYGIDSFVVELVESNIPDELIGYVEMYYISKYNTFIDNRCGYNMTLGGGGVAGYHFSEESRHKMSEAQKGKKMSEEFCKKTSERLTGGKLSKECREAISRSRKGRFTQEENPFYGRHHTQDVKEIISKTNSKFPVAQIDVNTGEVLNTFRNCVYAAQWLIENNKTSANKKTVASRICLLCRCDDYKSHTAYGFHWRYEKKSID